MWSANRLAASSTLGWPVSRCVRRPSRRSGRRCTLVLQPQVFPPLVAAAGRCSRRSGTRPAAERPGCGREGRPRAGERPVVAVLQGVQRAFQGLVQIRVERPMALGGPSTPPGRLVEVGDVPVLLQAVQGVGDGHLVVGLQPGPQNPPRRSTCEGGTSSSPRSGAAAAGAGHSSLPEIIARAIPSQAIHRNPVRQWLHKRIVSYSIVKQLSFPFGTIPPRHPPPPRNNRTVHQPNAACGRNQIRISKSEIRNKFKTRNPKVQNKPVHLHEFWILVLGVLDLFRFVLRISYFQHASTPHASYGLRVQRGGASDRQGM